MITERTVTLAENEVRAIACWLASTGWMPADTPRLFAMFRATTAESLVDVVDQVGVLASKLDEEARAEVGGEDRLIALLDKATRGEEK